MRNVKQMSQLMRWKSNSFCTWEITIISFTFVKCYLKTNCLINQISILLIMIISICWLSLITSLNYGEIPREGNSKDCKVNLLSRLFNICEDWEHKNIKFNFRLIYSSVPMIKFKKSLVNSSQMLKSTRNSIGDL